MFPLAVAIRPDHQDLSAPSFVLQIGLNPLHVLGLVTPMKPRTDETEVMTGTSNNAKGSHECHLR